MIIRRAPSITGVCATVTQSVTTPVTRLHSQKKQKILKNQKKEQIKILVFFVFFCFFMLYLRQTIVPVSEKARPRAEQRSPYEPSRHSPPQRRTDPDARSPALVRGDQEECG
jgi:hypothetical protein